MFTRSVTGPPRRAGVPHGTPLALLLALQLACSGGGAPEPADPAESAALELFELADLADPDPERLEALLGPFPDGIPAHLYDALLALREAGTPEVVGREELVDLDRRVLDLQAELEGGGTASYSLQLERRNGDAAPTQQTGGEHWRVVWFQGPGVDWPPHRSRGDGLSSSPDS